MPANTDPLKDDAPIRDRVHYKFDPPSALVPRCSTCRYYSVELEEIGVERWGRSSRGQCHRMPPLASTTRREDAFWPRVRSGDWCGEHQQRESDG